MIHHLIIPPITFFVFVAMFLYGKITIYFNFKRTKLCLQALRMRLNISFCPLFRNNYREKNIRARQDSLTGHS